MTRRKNPAARRAVVRMASDVTIEPVRWAWHNYLPAGSATLVSGDPEVGKGVMLADLVARWTRGDVMPDGSRSEMVSPERPGIAVVLDTEDDFASVLAKRWLAAGADLTRVSAPDIEVEITVEGEAEHRTVPTTWQIDRDVETVLSAIRETAVRAEATAGRAWNQANPPAVLLILDPVFEFLSSDVDTNTTESVRQAVQPAIRQITEATRRHDPQTNEPVAGTGATIVLVRHNVKSKEGRDAKSVGSGSHAWTAVARAEYLVAEDPLNESGDLKAFARVKNNLARKADTPALSFETVDTVMEDGTRMNTPHALWRGIAPYADANDLLHAIARAGKEERPSPKLEQAVDWLRRLLEAGPVLASDVKRAGDAAGHSGATLRRAQEALGVMASQERLENGRLGPSTWKLPLPPVAHDPSPVAQAPGQDTGCSSLDEQPVAPSHLQDTSMQVRAGVRPGCAPVPKGSCSDEQPDGCGPVAHHTTAPQGDEQPGRRPTFADMIEAVERTPRSSLADRVWGDD